MKEEILDEFENNEIENRNPISRIIQISIGTVFLFLLIERLRNFLPENLLNVEEVQIKTMGLIIMGIVILNSILIPTYLNKIQPKLNEVKVAIFSGLIIFATEIVFKLIQNFFLLKNGWDLEYLEIIKSAGMIGGIGILVANIRIHKIRNKRTLIPTILLIGIWFLFGLIMKK